MRYVYQPIESLFLLLITNKGSNIIEDLEILRLLAKVIPEYSKSMNEEAVSDNIFDLIMAFDEVVANGGYNEHVSISDVRLISYFTFIINLNESMFLKFWQLCLEK